MQRKGKNNKRLQMKCGRLERRKKMRNKGQESIGIVVLFFGGIALVFLAGMYRLYLISPMEALGIFAITIILIYSHFRK